MPRLALGARCNGLTTPALFAAALASAAPSFPFNNDPSARAPRPVELRARKARRDVSVFKSSIQFMKSTGSTGQCFVQIQQDVGNAGHRGEFDRVDIFRARGFADGEQIFRSLFVLGEVRLLFTIGLL